MRIPLAAALSLVLATAPQTGCGDDEPSSADSGTPPRDSGPDSPCELPAPPSYCGIACVPGSPCSIGFHCDPATSMCTSDCLEDGDAFCPEGDCTSDGYCVDASTICPDTSRSCGQACEGEPDAGLGLCGAPCCGDINCEDGFYCGEGETCTQDCDRGDDRHCPNAICSGDGRCELPVSLDGGNICARRAVPTMEQAPGGTCTFDFTGVVTDAACDPCMGGSFTIVEMGGNRIPVACDLSNGWQLTGTSQTNLYGAACDLFNGSPGATVDMSFPCDTVVLP